MRDAQFVFVTEDARVMAMLTDGRLEDVTDTCDLLPRSSVKAGVKANALACTDKLDTEDMRKKRRALILKFAA